MGPGKQRLLVSGVAAVTAVSVGGVLGHVDAPEAAVANPARPAASHEQARGPDNPAAPVHPAPLDRPVSVHPQGGAVVPAGFLDAHETATGIPDVALTAYQRAATVINRADPSCRIPWELLAAIGRVESDHGRYGGSHLGRDGLARPEILGPVLNGHGPVAAVPDTDAGALDHDKRWDRAVGPMQFLPSTWRVVGVDADGDGVRNPEDINDAALAAAVYLCAGGRHLDHPAEMARAVRSYNHSGQYVRVVLGFEHAYAHTEFAPALLQLPALDNGPVIPQPAEGADHVYAVARHHADDQHPAGGTHGLAQRLSDSHRLADAVPTGKRGKAGDRQDGSAKGSRIDPADKTTGTTDPTGGDTTGPAPDPTPPATTTPPTTDPSEPSTPTPSTPPPTGTGTPTPTQTPTQPPPTTDPPPPTETPTDPPPTEPATTTLTGTWTSCGTDTDPATYCVGSTTLTFGPGVLDATAPDDSDDASPQTNAAWFAAMAKEQDTVTVVVTDTDGTATVVSINGITLTGSPS